MFKVEQLPLWDVLKTVDDAQRAKVRKLLEDAAAILDRVIETFPTYTLHNSTHAENVVKLMADLLGDRVKDLTPLEAALLMLSAFYHDIGMVFREDERNRLPEEPEWKTFLDTKPDAYLAVKKAGEVPLDVAEWYCRWRHADRVYVYLNRLPDDLLKWGQTSIREELGEICRSHNLPAADLYALCTDFRSGEADLRFCAVLLRLADILDFDRTRSPEAVYEHLGLSRRIDPRQDGSDVEWLKHLCSEGFRFPKTRPDGYQLGFIAGPDEPGVEHDVREFLRVVEEEMEQCRVLLGTCSERWRALPLPVSIERSNIHGNGYRYGEYRFTLDQGQVMDLLMGENLYENPYVFVRELIQNAIDASRHRRFIERASGKPDFEPKPIEVRHWIDRDGYQWIRFDDYGMGMDEDIVRNHLLKVGSSYYNTASFRAEILRVMERTQEDFVPISRFGIGLLSCFIAGDRVEISTLRRASENGATVPIRLSLNGLHGFFTLQTPHLPALAMKSPQAEESGYRSDPGTSISVRLDPTKERGNFDPRALLKLYVNCPPVPIELDGESMGGDPARLLDQPWCEPTYISLDSDGMNSLNELLGRVFRDPWKVEIFPIDLTNNSPTSQLMGQGVLAVFRPSSELRQLRARLIKDKSNMSLSLGLSSPGGNLKLRVEFGLSSSNPFDLTFEGKSGSAYFPLPERLRQNLQMLDPTNRAWLSHNGITVPTPSPGKAPIRSSSWGTQAWWSIQISLTDSLRPCLSVSREELLSLPWNVYSTVGLALYRALASAGVDIRAQQWELFSNHPGLSLERPLTVHELLEDELIQIEEGWPSLPIIRTQVGLQSFHEIKESAEQAPLEVFGMPAQGEEHSYLSWCGAALVQLGLDASVMFGKKQREDRQVRIFVSQKQSGPISEGHKLFPPLTFLPSLDSRQLGYVGAPVLNINHPFATWLLSKAPEISKRYPGLFERIRSNLEYEWHWEQDRRSLIERLNSILDRLRELHPSVRPAKELVLREEDFLG